ncbi:Gfo/Idh/MocA family protein [Mucisphaera calidilacus]|uniref:Putative oxidoreductase YcjS n=1 Tax=Mucisphaera calidilacus TaxID=2527982 RepID=A0A518BWV8_9BACT|nr:Gfo/Idh/MocA family oxidoreductase [Mucisphaera calidilacus]QDU71462.1 putative oxidoreductase YcjS [Mucisphaera calidilacus]
MIRVGVCGLGMMGNTHLDVYSQMEGVEITAVADADPDRLSGKERAGGNIEGQAQGGFDLEQVERFSDAGALIKEGAVDVVDICLPTPAHLRFAVQAMEAGKHVLIEKPVARTLDQAEQLVAAARRASGMTMVAMCMRFWPGWDWLKQAVDQKTYGSVHAATFRRVAAHPGGAFYLNGDACGGAALDLHIHDTDFVQYCFGVPAAVTSRGYSTVTDAVDHITTQYHYDDVPLVTAEGGWAMASSFPFTMQYAVNFEKATAVFDLAAEHPLTLHHAGGDTQAIELDPNMGYQHELAYFIDCIRNGRTPDVVTVEDAATSLTVIEAEVESVRTGRTVTLS